MSWHQKVRYLEEQIALENFEKINFSMKK